MVEKIILERFQTYYCHTSTSMTSPRNQSWRRPGKFQSCSTLAYQNSPLTGSKQLLPWGQEKCKTLGYMMPKSANGFGSTQAYCITNPTKRTNPRGNPYHLPNTPPWRVFLTHFPLYFSPSPQAWCNLSPSLPLTILHSNLSMESSSHRKPGQQNMVLRKMCWLPNVERHSSPSLGNETYLQNESKCGLIGGMSGYQRLWS